MRMSEFSFHVLTAIRSMAVTALRVESVCPAANEKKKGGKRVRARVNPG